MITIVKKPIRWKQLKGKYVFRAWSNEGGEYAYASIGIRPLVSYLIRKLKNNF